MAQPGEEPNAAGRLKVACLAVEDDLGSIADAELRDRVLDDLNEDFDSWDAGVGPVILEKRVPTDGAWNVALPIPIGRTGVDDDQLRRAELPAEPNRDRLEEALASSVGFASRSGRLDPAWQDLDGLTNPAKSP